MIDTPLELDAFARDRDAARERRVPGRAAEVVLHRAHLHGRTVSEPVSW